MKRKSSKNHQNGNGHISPQALVARAAATKKLAKAARKHLKMLKAEHRQARKAFRQAKEAARNARKEAKAALRSLKPKSGTRKTKPVPQRRTAARKVTATRPTVSQPAQGVLPAPERTNGLVAV